MTKIIKSANGIEVEEIPAREFDKCRHCGKALDGNYFAGWKRRKRKGAGLNASGEYEDQSLSKRVTYYYCSEECLDKSGAVPEETFNAAGGDSYKPSKEDFPDSF